MNKAFAALLAVLAICITPAAAGAVPVVTTKDATDITATGATLNGKVPAAADATTYHFEYGPTTAYESQTPARTAAASKSVTSVRYAVAGLVTGAEYHFRLVAETSGSAVYGQDLTFVPADAVDATTPTGSTGPTGETGPTGSGGATGPTGPRGDSFTEPIGDVGPGSRGPLGSSGSTAPKPVLGETVGAGPASGAISVRVPGSPGFVPLAGGAAIPAGSTVDARHGTVRIVTAVGDSGATQSASFRGAKFKVIQRKRARGLTDIVLRGGNFAACGATPGHARVLATAARKRRHVVRRLWGRDHHGRFRTHGRHSVAAVRGTVWIVADRCDGTRTSVKRGAVSVRDLGRHRTVHVRAHHHYLARSAR
jgi:hypothetical protein